MRALRLCSLTSLVALTAATLAGCAPTVGSGPRAKLSHDSPEIDLTRLERDVQERGNVERRRAGASPLRWSDSLATIARRHSADMARRGYFAHVTPDGLDPSARARAYGLRCEITEGRTVWRGVAENLSYTQRFSSGRTITSSDGRSETTYDWKTTEDLAAEVVSRWMASPGHRANLLNPRSRRAGVGVAPGPEHRLYFTHVFC